MTKTNNKLKNAHSRKSKRTCDIRCLCTCCLRDYINSGNFIVKRVDPFQRVKEKCDKCTRQGYDYFVIKRQKTVDK